MYREGEASDTKKALNNLLFHTRGSRDFLQNEWHFGKPNRVIRDRHIKKKSPPGRGKKPRDKKTKRWHRDGSPGDDEFDAETTFADKFRESWYHKPQSQKASSCSRDSTSGFEWREGFSWTNQSQRSNNWDDESSCDEEANRRIPVSEDSSRFTSKCFRSAALKWHPDKHQGPSQEAAQEKFKLCVDAYKSLCYLYFEIPLNSSASAGTNEGRRQISSVRTEESEPSSSYGGLLGMLLIT